MTSRLLNPHVLLYLLLSRKITHTSLICLHLQQGPVSLHQAFLQTCYLLQPQQTHNAFFYCSSLLGVFHSNVHNSNYSLSMCYFFYPGLMQRLETYSNHHLLICPSGKNKSSPYFNAADNIDLPCFMLTKEYNNSIIKPFIT